MGILGLILLIFCLNLLFRTFDDAAEGCGCLFFLVILYMLLVKGC